MGFECCKTKKSKINIFQTVKFLKIIADKNRLHILCILSKGEKCVCEIWQNLELPQNLISHHLKVLKEFKLVKAKKESTKVIYSINKQTVDKYYSYLSHYLNNK